MTDRNSVCACGHPYEAHEIVPGFTCAPGVTINGRSFWPDVWACTGVRLVDLNKEDLDPWDSVCGCVLQAQEQHDD